MAEKRSATPPGDASAPGAVAARLTGAPGCPPQSFSHDEILELMIAGSDWIWETDAELRFSWLSQEFETVTGIAVEKALGRRRFDLVQQVSHGTKDVDAHLEDLMARRPFRGFIYELKGGRKDCRWVSSSGYPRFDAAGVFIGYRGIGRNATGVAASFQQLQKVHGALARHEEQTRILRDALAGESHAERLMAALDVVSDAFCYYDSDDRMVLYNEALIDLYQGLADIIRPGLEFSRFLDVGLERGCWDTEGLTSAEWRDAILTRRRYDKQSQSLFRFSDGRCVIHREVASADGGTIATCTDITELERRQVELVRAGKTTDQLLDDLRRTVDSMMLGVVIVDAGLRIEIINRAFYSIWKATPDEVEVGKPFRELMNRASHGDVYGVAEAEWEAYVASRLAEIKAGDVAPREFRRADGCTMIYSVTALSGGKRLISYYDISALKDREAQTEEAHRRLADVLESLPAGVIIFDRDDRFVLANRRMKDTWPAMEAHWKPGAPLKALLAAMYEAGYNPDTGDPSIHATEPEAWAESQVPWYHLRHSVSERKHQDGRWFQDTNTRTDDGTFIGVRADITEIKERERALQSSMRKIELYRHVLDELPVSTYVKSADLAFEFVNKVWTDLSGVPKEEALGRTDLDFFGEQGKGFAARDLSVLSTGLTSQAEEMITHLDGTTRHLIAKKSRLISSDGTVHLIGSSTDISELKAHELELKEAQRRAVLSDRAKSEFLANMSHEIRTPMNGVLGMAELLAKSDLDPKQRTFTEIIVKSGNALLTIINDILDFSKIDAGQLVLDPAPFRLVEAIEDVAALISTRAKEKDIELIVRIAPGLHDVFVGDAGRIRQIITNLIGNAVKFTDAGHVLVNVSGRPDGDATRLQVSVSDTGIGIPADKLGMVFEKFSQVDGTSTRRHEGTGLGLAITSRLVALMNGEIGVESQEGKGSTFWFTVSLPRADSSPPLAVPPSDVTGARVLIVDDNPVNRAILSEQMSSWAFDACAAESGEEGLLVLKAAAERGIAVDCIVLDHQMPGMSGGEVARIVRESRPIGKVSVAETPIVMLTSVDQSLPSASYRDLAIEAQLIKPARSSALLATVVAAIQRRRAGATAATGADENPGFSGDSATAPPDPPSPTRQGFSPRAGPRSADDAAHRVDILVAEDNEVNQLVFTQILGETNYSFEIVGNGKLALSAFSEMNPRMILMDVSMPEMNGLEATSAIRALEAGSDGHVPIVGVTAHALKGDRERCIDAGMDDYLPKPISPRALVGKIERWIWRETRGGRTSAG